MTELDGNDTRWTDEARESLRTAAANLVEAIHRHSTTLLELTATTDPEAVEEAIAEADELLEASASAYADAQFELSGTVPPLGLDEEDEYAYEDEDEDAELELVDAELAEPASADDPESGEPDLKLTVLHRADFVVTDEQAVIQAGKDAYHETWDPADEPVDVADLGEALQQLRQAGGIEVLAETPGLSTAGATTWILEATELLDEHDPDEWHTPFATGPDTSRLLLLRVDELAG
ncbi:hypothetical protein [Actinophytocola sediminis]